MKKKILLVGANGYIGSLLYKRLKSKFDIYPIDNYFRKTRKQKFVIKKDYRDLSERFLKNFQLVYGFQDTHLFNNQFQILLAQ